MSGASSAFLDGYLSDRERARMKKKDLELSEIIELCAQPESFEDRVATVRRYAEAYPELKYFLVVAYFCKGVFSQVNERGPVDYQPSRVQKGASAENISSMWKQVCRMYDTFPTGPRTKRGIAQQLLPSLHKDDAELISQLLAGTFYRKELNEKVVQAAFPNETPKDPKV
jgi:hypothetical protein